MAKTIAAAKRTMAALLPVSVLWAMVAGCDGNKTGSVSGIVTYKGKLMPGGYIDFYSIAADGKVIAQKSTAIGDDGAYTITKVPIGDAKITVQEPPGALVPNATEKGGLPRRAPPAVTLPPKYQNVEQTDLKYTVAPGNQKHDVAMQ